MVDFYEGVGLGFAITGLALVLPFVFLFKQYFRFLDHVQFVYLYWYVLANAQNTFAKYLKDSWSVFIPNFLNFCTNGDFVCTSGFALSFTICLIGTISLIFLIVSFQKCRKPDLIFQPVYCIFKGLFRWTYIALIYYSAYIFFTNIKSGTISGDFIPSLIVFTWTILFPVIQLIVYKVIQKEDDNKWIKWIQFLCYVRTFSISLLLALSQVFSNNIPKYFIYGPLVIYAALYLWKNNFTYKIVERVLFGLGEAAAITIFSLYLFETSYIKYFDLDFLLLGFILLTDFIYYIIKFVSWLKYGKVSIDKINPQQVQQQQSKGRQPQVKRQIQNVQVVNINDDFKLKKKSKYQESQESINLQNSRDSLNNSIIKGNSRRRRK